MYDNKSHKAQKKHIDDKIVAVRGGWLFAEVRSEPSLCYGKKEKGLSRLPVPTCAGIPDIARPPIYPTRGHRAGYVSAGLSAPFSFSCVLSPPPFCAQKWYGGSFWTQGSIKSPAC